MGYCIIYRPIHGIISQARADDVYSQVWVIKLSATAGIFCRLCQEISAVSHQRSRVDNIHVQACIKRLYYMLNRHSNSLRQLVAYFQTITNFWSLCRQKFIQNLYREMCFFNSKCVYVGGSIPDPMGRLLRASDRINGLRVEAIHAKDKENGERRLSPKFLDPTLGLKIWGLNVAPKCRLCINAWNLTNFKSNLTN